MSDPVSIRARSLLLAATLSTLVLSGCFTARTNAPGENAPKEAWDQQISAQYDSQQKIYTVTGGNVRKSGSSLFLRSIRTAGRSDLQVYIEAHYTDDWRMYDRAVDAEGHELPATTIARKMGVCIGYECTHVEHIGVTVTPEYLQTHVKGGIDLELSGKGRKQRFHVPGPYIRSFLAALETKGK